MRALHRIAHWLGFNLGRVETWHKGNKLMVGFRCVKCGQLSHVHEREGDLL